MVPEIEKPKVTEMQVRMDCNGCVQKIKKALHGINGIYDIYTNIPQQKLTIISWADPEKIVKAIKRTRKTATICSHVALMESEPPLEGEPPPLDPTNHPPGEEAPPPEQIPPTEPPPVPDDPPPDGAAAAPPLTEPTPNEPPPSPRQKEVEEVHVVYQYPPDHQDNVRVYNGHVNHYPSGQNGPGFKHEPSPPPIHVNHSYNTYKPIPYVTEYEYIRQPPRYTSYTWPESTQQYKHYSRSEPPQQQYKHYSHTEPPPQHYRRPEPPSQPYNHQEPTKPQHHSHSESPPPQFNQPELPPQPYSPPEPPPQPYSRQEPRIQPYSRQEPRIQPYSRQEPRIQPYSRPEPSPQPYSQQEPPPQPYSRRELPTQQSHTDSPQNYRQPESPREYTHYNRAEPPQQYTHYNRLEPTQQYTLHSRPEPLPLHTYYSRLGPPEYIHYNDDYHSSTINDGITLPFGDEDPNGCTII